MKVKIKSAKHRDFWYAGMIGEEVEVLPGGHYGGEEVYTVEREGRTHYILPEDAEPVSDIGQKAKKKDKAEKKRPTTNMTTSEPFGEIM